MCVCACVNVCTKCVCVCVCVYVLFRVSYVRHCTYGNVSIRSEDINLIVSVCVCGQAK